MSAGADGIEGKGLDVVREVGQIGDEEVHLRAIVVGISDFEACDPKDRYQPDRTVCLDLEYGAADAMLLYEFLRSPSGGGLEPGDIRLLVDEPTRHRVVDELSPRWKPARWGPIEDRVELATRANVLAALDDVLVQADSRDVVTVWFSTHGTWDRSADQDRAKGFLMTVDTDPSRLQSTAVSFRRLELVLDETLASYVNLFTDACHSGFVGASGERSTSADDLTRTIMEIQGQGLFNMASSLGRQLSLEGPEFCGGQGAFACELVRSLRGDADSDGDGFVTTGELAARLPTAVREATGGRQQPVPNRDFDPRLPVGRVTRHEVRFDSTPRGAAIAINDNSICEQTPCTVHLSPGSYDIRWELDRHVSVEEAVRVDQPTTISRTLQSQVALIEVRTPEPGVPVWIDGAVAGETPWQGSLAVGVHRIDIEGMEGYPRTIEVRADEKLALEAGFTRTTAVQLTRRQRQATGLLVAGAGCAVASGVLFGVAAETRQQFLSTQSPDLVNRNYASFFTGAGLAATSVAFIVTSSVILASEKKRLGGMSVAPTLAPGAVGLMVQGQL